MIKCLKVMIIVILMVVRFNVPVSPFITTVAQCEDKETSQDGGHLLRSSSRGLSITVENDCQQRVFTQQHRQRSTLKPECNKAAL